MNIRTNGTTRKFHPPMQNGIGESRMNPLNINRIGHKTTRPLRRPGRRLAAVATGLVILVSVLAPVSTVQAHYGNWGTVGNHVAGDAICNEDATITVYAPSLWANDTPAYTPGNVVVGEYSQPVAYRADLYRWDGAKWSFVIRGPAFYGITTQTIPPNMQGTLFHGLSGGYYRVIEHMFWYDNNWNLTGYTFEQPWQYLQSYSDWCEF